MARWIYTGDTPGQLTDGSFFAEVYPGQEFDAPDDWKPEPYPHPTYKPAPVKKPAPAKAPQE